MTKLLASTFVLLNIGYPSNLSITLQSLSHSTTDTGSSICVTSIGGLTLREWPSVNPFQVGLPLTSWCLVLTLVLQGERSGFRYS